MAIEEMIYAHAVRYPKMLPADLVKLIYQSEFGPGHYVADEGRAMAYLASELAAAKDDPAVPLSEEIGGGFVRVNLSAIPASGISAEELCRAFVASANMHTGDKMRFEEKLRLACRAVAKRPGLFSFTEGELADFLAEYSRLGCPPLSHSAQYKAEYAPAYRVVLKGLLPHMGQV